MDTDSNKSLGLGKLSAFVPLISMPPRPLPSTLLANFTVNDDVQLVSTGALKALCILEDNLKKELEDYALEMLTGAATEPAESPTETPSPVDNPPTRSSTNSSNAISPQSTERIIKILREQPKLLDKLPLESSQALRMYATNCWAVLVSIIDILGDSRKTNRIIQDITVQPMSVVQHNSLAQLLFDHMPEIVPETLFKYLDAVEASCRLQQQGSMQQVHNVRLAVKVVDSALDLNNSFVDAMFIELSSFCLSYSWVKDALDLYRRLMTTQQQQQQQQQTL
ncbi:hypothetical protein IW140_004852 [Coemansia sp. RSA 1813]|nr:hypothetical protein EV178_004898 [Coemansia sp. RSA 1646]KAJ1769501.1 hypothetical protein LPJ74_003987 [Coemansia sp. RSA 1843]KAJ2087484.1 hypothetical protein IW138_004944 [Coemansia sp. RSA 986]KAJ2211697.1 hypothetical protein EV179_005254 [Coemansia sp. RSA 487]KAJ2566664.1 hypothetical protein IW140_004852 [Coemansia sp. RSA 1813]